MARCDTDRSPRLCQWPVVALHRVTTRSRTARQAARVMAGSRPPPTLAGMSVHYQRGAAVTLPVRGFRLAAVYLEPPAALCQANGGRRKLEVGGFEDSLCRG